MSESSLDPSIFSEMRDLMDDDLEEFIRTFLENTPRLIGLIEQGLNDHNSEDIFQNAHQLKGGSGSIGALKLSDVAQNIEKIARNGSIENIDSLLLSLKQEFSQVEDALKAEL